MGRPRWAKVVGTVRPSTVVMPNVLREHQTQVPLTEDQHTVGEFGSDSAHEPFGETVRLRQRGGVLTTWMPTSARTASKMLRTDRPDRGRETGTG
jgi:hypothetical protein